MVKKSSETSGIAKAVSTRSDSGLDTCPGVWWCLRDEHKHNIFYKPRGTPFVVLFQFWPNHAQSRGSLPQYEACIFPDKPFSQPEHFSWIAVS